MVAYLKVFVFMVTPKLIIITSKLNQITIIIIKHYHVMLTVTYFQYVNTPYFLFFQNDSHGTICICQFSHASSKGITGY